MNYRNKQPSPEDDCEFVLSTSNGGKTWEISLWTSTDGYIRLASLICPQSVASFLVDACNSYRQNGDYECERYITEKVPESKDSESDSTGPLAAIKRFMQKEESLSLLGIFYTVCESRIDPSHKCHRVAPDWAVLAYQLRTYLQKEHGSLRSPMPFIKPER